MILPPILLGWPWNIDTVFIAMGFMLWGFGLRELIDQMENHLLLNWIILTAISIFSYINTTSIGNVHVARAYLGNPCLFIFFAMSGSSMTICFAKLTVRIIETGKLIDRSLSFIGRNTFAFLVIQKPLIEISESVCEFIGVKEYLAMVISFTITLILSMCITWVMNFLAPYLGGHRIYA